MLFRRNRRQTPRGNTSSPRPRRIALTLEALEERLVPTNYFVSTLGNDVPGGGSQAAPFRSIQYAVNQAQSGDRIHVAGGTYGYNPAADQLSAGLGVSAVVEIYDKQLQLFGGFDNGFTTRSAATPTVIDGGGALRGVFVLANTVDVSLQMDGFTIQDGAAHGEPALQGNDRTFAFGGGMWINTGARPNSSGPFTLSNVTFQNNSATARSSDGVGGALALYYVKDVRLQNVSFVGNVSQPDPSQIPFVGQAVGGALQADHSNITGNNITFTNNRAFGGEGGQAAGGAAAIQFGSTVSWQNVTATGNQARGGPDIAAGLGGAFFVESASLTLTDANVRGNTAEGGGINNSTFFSGGSPSGSAGGGGVAVVSDVAGLNASLTLERVQLVGNLAQSGRGSRTRAGDAGGGGLYLAAVTGQAPATINNSLIADNVVRLGQSSGGYIGSGGGGGLWLKGASANVTQTTIANNQLGPGLTVGQAVLLSDNGVPASTVATIAYSIIANHTGGSNLVTAVEASRSDPAGRDVVHYTQSLYANNALDDDSAAVPAAFTGLATMLHAADAGFASAGTPNEDYRLVPGSPAIDAATGSTATVDLNNFPRDAHPDLGAFELGSVPTTPQAAGQVPARSSAGVFDPATATWYLRNENGPGTPDVPPFAYGAPGWIPVVGDWDGNGTQTIGVFDPSTATWYLKNGNGPGAPDIKPFRFGAPGWQPVVGDWDGDGKWTIGVVDPNGVWYLRNSNTPGAPDITPFRYGAGSWKPVADSWSGTSGFGIGMFDPATATWYLRGNASPGAPDVGHFAFGGAGWQPVVGDWNNDGKATVGVVDPSGTWYLRNSNTPGAPDVAPFGYGAGSWVAVAGDYDGKASLRAASGEASTPLSLAARQGSLLGLRELQAFYAQVLNVLRDAGVSGSVLTQLGAVGLQVSHFGSGLLGETFPDKGVIALDDDAAGYGWFIDPTPAVSEEYDAAGVALAGGPAAGRMDLLTTVVHEMGHVLGLPDLDPASDPAQLMTGTLPAGVRRAALDAFFARE
jgi:hypothetical protein